MEPKEIPSIEETSDQVLERLKKNMIQDTVRSIENSKRAIKYFTQDIEKLEKEIAKDKEFVKTSEDLLVQYNEFSPIDLATKQREALNIEEKPLEDDGLVKILEWIKQNTLNRNKHMINSYTNWIEKREKKIKDIEKEIKSYEIDIVAFKKLLEELEKIISNKNIKKWRNEVLKRYEPRA